MYTQYCADQAGLLKSITDARRDKTFNEFLNVKKKALTFLKNQSQIKKIKINYHPKKKFKKKKDVKFNNPKSKGLDVSSYLIKPVQRICKYPLLLEQLLKFTPKDHNDYEKLFQATQKMNSVVDVINKGKRQLETFHKASFLQIEIERVLEGKFQLMKIGRFYIREGDFYKISGQKTLQQRLYLFNDLVIYGKIINPNKKTEKFKFKGHIYLSKLYLEQLSENEITPKINNENAFKFTRLDGNGKEKQYILVAKTKEEKYLWKKELEELIKENKKQKRTTRYSLVASPITDTSELDTSIRDLGNSVNKRKKDHKLIQWRKSIKQQQMREQKLNLKELETLNYFETVDDSEVISDHQIPESYKNSFSLYPPLCRVSDKFSSIYSSLVNSVKRFHQYENLEILLLGEKGSGKSSILEAITGIPVCSGEPIKSVIHFRLLNNPLLEQPRYTVSTKKRGNYIFDSLDQFNKKLLEYASFEDKAPVYATFESKHCWNVTVIDTPPFDINMENSVTQTLKLASFPNRKIFCVVPTKPVAIDSSLLDFVKQNLDPYLKRTNVIRSKFQLYTNLLNETEKIENFFKQAYSVEKSFFVSCFSKFTRSSIENEEELENLILANDSFLNSTLSRLNTNSNVIGHIGIIRFRKYLVDLLFQNEMKVISSIPYSVNKNISLVNSQIEIYSLLEKKDYNLQFLKQTLSSYSTRFYNAVDLLLRGSLSHSPPKTGYTLYQEKMQLAFCNWLPPSVIEMNGESDVPFDECSLGPGGAQLQRTIENFKSVSNSLKLEFNQDSLIPHSDKVRQSEISHQIAQESLVFQFQSIIENFVQRISTSCNLISETAFSIAQSEIESAKSESIENYFCLERYSHLSLFLKQHFSHFISQRLQVWVDKSLEYLTLNRFPFWRLKNFINLEFVPKIPEFPDTENDEYLIRSSIFELAQDLFEEIKLEVSQKCLMDLYEIFLIPLLTPNFISSSIHSYISLLPEIEITQLFHTEIMKQEIQSSAKEKESLKNQYSQMRKEYSVSLEKFYHLRQILI